MIITREHSSSQEYLSLRVYFTLRVNFSTREHPTVSCDCLFVNIRCLLWINRIKSRIYRPIHILAPNIRCFLLIFPNNSRISVQPMDLLSKWIRIKHSGNLQNIHTNCQIIHYNSRIMKENLSQSCFKIAILGARGYRSRRMTSVPIHQRLAEF